MDWKNVTDHVAGVLYSRTDSEAGNGGNCWRSSLRCWQSTPATLPVTLVAALLAVRLFAG